eukprot:SM000076S21858  [mRNA]  locus=s76:509422:512028:+ [translate_table: standard]
MDASPPLTLSDLPPELDDSSDGSDRSQGAAFRPGSPPAAAAAAAAGAAAEPCAWLPDEFDDIGNRSPLSGPACWDLDGKAGGGSVAPSLGRMLAVRGGYQPPPPLPRLYGLLDPPFREVLALTSLTGVAKGTTRRLHSVLGARSGPLQKRLPAAVRAAQLVTAAVDTPESRIKKQLLAFAEAVATDDQARARFLMTVLGRAADRSGTYVQRIAYYFMEALWARTQGEVCIRQQRLATESMSEPMVSAMGEFQQHMPYIKFCHGVANATILEVAAACRRIHILDIATWTGQWPGLLHALALLPGGPPHVRITRVHDSHIRNMENTCANEQYLSQDGESGKQVLAVANSLGVQLEFHVIETRLESLQPYMISAEEGEVLVVNDIMGLSFLPDASLLRSSPRDAALRALCRLRPHIMVLVEMHSNDNSPFFLQRFKQCLDIYMAAVEATDVHMPSTSLWRRVAEQHILSQHILEVVACEGLLRHKRTEYLSKWQSRMKDAGFVCRPWSEAAKDQPRAVAEQHVGFSMAEPGDALMLKWKSQPLIHATLWRPAC